MSMYIEEDLEKLNQKVIVLSEIVEFLSESCSHLLSDVQLGQLSDMLESLHELND